jgi:hypothetical protein
MYFTSKNLSEPTEAKGRMWFEWEMSPLGLCAWTCYTRLVELFGKAVETLGSRACWGKPVTRVNFETLTAWSHFLLVPFLCFLWVDKNVINQPVLSPNFPSLLLFLSHHETLLIPPEPQTKANPFFPTRALVIICYQSRMCNLGVFSDSIPS